MITLATIQKAQHHDKVAQKQLFEGYATVIYRLAFRYLRERADAEDVVSEAFCLAFENMAKATFTSVPFFEAWLKRITVNEALKSLRKRASFHLLSDTELEIEAISDNTIEKLSVAQIWEIVSQLPVGYRTVFNLYEIEGYSHAEIAKMLNISEGTSKSQLSKAKSLLQKKVIELEKDYAQSKTIR
ncbi:MAG: sigma-70 family RNA polymerase sigma factor [Bacteroidetes bacterium]|nr:sigma-70 family RNA polymerase sigma factor [Bacteroidota bacterium]